MSAVSLPQGFSIAGGIPTKSQDLAASVIFIIAYLALAGPCIYRVASKASRSTLLIRPAIFVLARLVTYIIRAVQSNGNYSSGLFIAEQILLLAGFVVICEPLLANAKNHITRFHDGNGDGAITQQAMRLLRLALMAALIIGIYVGTQFGSVTGANPDLSKLNTLKSLRVVNGAICLAVVVALFFVTAIAQAHKPGLPLKSTLLILFASSTLIVASAYRLSSYKHATDPFSKSNKAKFYILFAAMEWLAASTSFVVNNREWFAEETAKAKEQREKDMKNGNFGAESREMEGGQYR